MAKEYTKADNNTLKITDTTPNTVVETYMYQDLISKRNDLITSRDSLVDSFNKQIATIQADIDAADQLQIVAVPLIVK